MLFYFIYGKEAVFNIAEYEYWMEWLSLKGVFKNITNPQVLKKDKKSFTKIQKMFRQPQEEA